jgi:hypothetical protein
MNKTAIVYTSAPNSSVAAEDLCTQITRALDHETPDVIVLFASPRYDHGVLLSHLERTCTPKILVGASSAGEFTSTTRGEGLACALALRSDEMEFTAGVGRGLGRDRAAAAREMVRDFRGLGVHAYPYRSALVMTDALAGHADDLVEQLTLVTSGKYQFFGGGAGDDAQFKRTQVFFGTEALSDAAVVLEIVSKKPLGVGVGHGWEPAGAAMRVTEAVGATLVSLNGLPTVDCFEDHALATGQAFNRAEPLPFFLHNIIGIDTGDGYRLRVPLAVLENGAVACASEIPVGAKVHIMRTTSSSAVDAAVRATKSALDGLHGHRPQAALFFDCVATRLRMGDAFGLELQSLGGLLGPAAGYVGCNTHGQIARAEGQFGGFHNCTAVVCVFPE